MEKKLISITQQFGVISQLIVLCLTMLLWSQSTKGQALVNISGTVTGYVAPGANTAGSISINGTTYPILPGTSLTGTNLVGANGNLALTATVNANGVITAGNISVNNGVPTLSTCGLLSAVSANSITINGVTIPIASGTLLNGLTQANVGANICLTATLNTLGEITTPNAITTQATTSVFVCGAVSALSANSITINGTTYAIVPGVTLLGINQATVGANVCLSAQVNPLNQIVALGQVLSASICGTVSALTSNSITINGTTYFIAPGVNINGINQASVGANVCLNAALNGLSQIVAPSSISLQGTAPITVNVCGVVSALSSNSITINGVTYPLASGAAINGANLVNVGANACLTATLNASGQIEGPSSITAQVAANVNVCGVVSAISSNAITINGVTYPIVPGGTITGASLVNVGANVCLNAALNASGQITAPSSISISPTLAVNLCAKVDAYQAATASAPGFITLGGTTLPIAIGSQLAGSETITVGANLCLNATLNASGQIILPSSIAVNVNTTTNICGKVTAFIAATVNTPGSITVGGVTLTILPGVVLSGVGVGAEICLTTPGGTGNGGNPVGQVGPGTIITNVDGSCNQLKFTAPLATHGFLKSPFLPDGDLFLLKQGLSFNVVSPPASGVEVFDVSPSTFGGTSVDVGSFTGVSTGITLQGLAVSATGRTIKAVSCTDSVQKLDFVLAGSGNVGSTVRLFLQNADGSNGQQLGLFTAEAGGWRVTSLHSNVSLFLNNRFVTGNGQLSVGALIPMSDAAGSAGSRTKLLTLAFSKTVASTLNGCNQLGVEVANTGGKTSIVITDVVVNRIETPGDRARTELGLLAGVGGGYPTGVPCATICAPCNASAQSTATTVSGASYDRNSVTSDGIVSVFGTGLASSTQGAISQPLPTVLAGISVTITDNLGVKRLAPLFYVSPTQINFLVPNGTATGDAALTITNGNNEIAKGTVKINAVAPGLFSTDASGQGIAAGLAVRVKADGTQIITPLDAAIDLGVTSERVYLVLFGTGIRFRSGTADVQAQVGGLNLAVDYAGAQGEFAGLDQVNLLLPTSLSGSGQTKVSLKVDGKISNQVGITIK